MAKGGLNLVAGVAAVQRYFFARAGAVSSRGLGRSPLKAQTRVRIPLPLSVVRPHRLTARTPLFQGGNRGSIPLGGNVMLKACCVVLLAITPLGIIRGPGHHALHPRRHAARVQLTGARLV